MIATGYWQEFATTDFQGLDPQCCVALLPVAAIEQHGPHLPLATDAIINAGIIQRLLRTPPAAATVLVLPALDIGDSLEHSAFPGTLSVASEILLRHWLQVAQGVVRAGLRKLVIFNTHGGQIGLVDQLALRLRVEQQLLVARASSFHLGFPPGLFDPLEIEHGLHGGEVETSMMLALRPDLVRLRALENFRGLSAELAARAGVLGVERPAGFGWMSQDLHPAGVCGDALAADAERGLALLEHLAKRLAALLQEVVDTPLAVLRGPPPWAPRP
jgi:creatinine amidohydrolase